MYFILLLLFIPISVHALTLILGGGALADNNTDVWDRFIFEAGGYQARIGVVTCASDTPEDSADYYLSLIVRSLLCSQSLHFS